MVVNRSICWISFSVCTNFLLLYIVPLAGTVDNDTKLCFKSFFSSFQLGTKQENNTMVHNVGYFTAIIDTYYSNEYIFEIIY